MEMSNSVKITVLAPTEAYGTFTNNGLLSKSVQAKRAGLFSSRSVDEGSFKRGQSLPSSMSSDRKYVMRQLHDVPRIKINRSVMDQQILELCKADSDTAGLESFGDKFRRRWRRIDCFQNLSCRNICFNSLPILNWLPKYSCKNNFVADIIAGLTVAVMQVPQGMAYAMLANVPPVVGLYTSFFPALAYFIFGTSRHGSIGTFALISMLTNTAMEDVVGSLREQQMDRMYPNGTLPSNGTSGVRAPTDEDLGIDPIEVAVVVAFVVGMAEIFMGVARLGYLTVLMSDKMISGLITGTAVQVLTSQIRAITGATIPKFSGIFNTIFTWISFCENLHTIKWTVVLVSFVSFVFMMLIKFCVDPCFKKKTNVPFPSELLLIIFVTFFSYFFNFNEIFSMDIIGDIPTGLVPPKVPTFSFIPQLLTGSAMVTIVGVSLSLSIVLSYGKKHNYLVDSNQELIAYGAANVVGSFFSCIPCSISLSRSAVLDSSGAKTQVATLVSCGVLLVVILVLGPLFSSLPDAVLSIIIVVALRSMLAGVADLIPAWKAAKADAVVWLSTFLGVVVLDIDYGLGIGVFVSLACFALKAHRPGEIFVLGRLGETEIYLNVDKYGDSVQEVPGVKIYGVPGPIYFGNRDFVKSEILKDVDNAEDGDISHVVICFAAVSFIDSGGIEAMKTLNKELDERGVIMYLAAPTDSVLNAMQKCDYFPDLSSKSVVFPSTHDAVTRASHRSDSQKSTSQEQPRDHLEDRESNSEASILISNLI